jgi:uncharacterized protein involved in response to NO
VHLGVINTLAGWVAGLVILLHRCVAGRRQDLACVSCSVALCLGLIGLWSCSPGSCTATTRGLPSLRIKFGSFGLLLPIYVTVAHRMFPFFAGNVVAGYRPWRSLRWLAAVLDGAAGASRAGTGACLCMALWVADLPLLALVRLLAVARLAARSGSGLLRVLFARLRLVAGGDRVVCGPEPVVLAGWRFRARPRAGACLVRRFLRQPAGGDGDARDPGPFGSPAAARPGRGVRLHRDPVRGVLRIVAELVPDAPAWQAFTAIGWLLAFLPWVLRSGYIYLTPRADHKPG